MNQTQRRIGTIERNTDTNHDSVSSSEDADLTRDKTPTDEDPLRRRRLFAYGSHRRGCAQVATCKTLTHPSTVQTLVCGNRSASNIPVLRERCILHPRHPACTRQAMKRLSLQSRRIHSDVLAASRQRKQIKRRPACSHVLWKRKRRVVDGKICFLPNLHLNLTG